MTYDNMIDAAPTTTTCPKCGGTGRFRLTLPGGWLVKPCDSCRGAGPVGAAPCCGDEAEPCRECVPPEVRERDNAAAWRAVQEGLATFLVDRPEETPGPYRDDLDDFIPTPADEEWRLRQIAAEHERFVRLFTRPESVYRYVDESPDSDWAARQMGELARLARATDATDVGTMIDRLIALAGTYA